MAHRTQGQDFDADVYGDGTNLRGSKPESAPSADDATYLPAELINMMQEELCNAITAGNVTVSYDATTDRSNGWAQLAKAIFNNKAITEHSIADRTVKAMQIALSTILGNNIANYTITGNKLVLDDTLSFTNDQYQKLVVKLKTGQALEFQQSVSAGGTSGINVRDGGIKADMLATNSVGTDALQQDSVDTYVLKVDSVSEDHIIDNAVGYGKIDSNAVGPSQLRSEAVTMPKLNQGLGIANNIRYTGTTQTINNPRITFGGAVQNDSPLTIGTWYEVTARITNLLPSGNLNISRVSVHGRVNSTDAWYALSKDELNAAVIPGSDDTRTFLFQLNTTYPEISVKYDTDGGNSYKIYTNFKRLNSKTATVSSVGVSST